MIYLLYLCDALNIDLTQAVVDKIEINEKGIQLIKLKVTVRNIGILHKMELYSGPINQFIEDTIQNRDL
jgi:hypothetical protein